MSEIIDKITAKVKAEGIIPFERFMELALYCPDCGFYEKEKDNLGKRGDFFTSVSVGELFGQLLGFQFSDWLNAQDGTPNAQYGTGEGPVRIVEAGAHDGRLARDILGWLRDRRPAMLRRLEYCLVEPSARRREWQKAMLRDFSGTVKWVSEITDLHLALQASRTVIFSNELLDALPVQRLGWDAKGKKWFEWGVALRDERFVWSRLENCGFRLPSRELEAVLPDGYTLEISPAAEKWWRTAAGVLASGKLLALDYGFAADEQFSPSRLNGTLRAYHRHQVTADVLANPGEQDLTAHVNFPAIREIGEAAGLRTESFGGQPQFLTRIVEKIFREPASFGEWGPKQTRQFQTLTHPEHLGRAFRVLVQSRP